MKLLGKAAIHTPNPNFNFAVNQIVSETMLRLTMVLITGFLLCLRICDFT